MKKMREYWSSGVMENQDPRADVHACMPEPFRVQVQWPIVKITPFLERLQRGRTVKVWLAIGDKRIL